MDKKYSLNYFYPEAISNGYGKEFAMQRFEILKEINFSSILDIGSGPCFLYDWIRLNKKGVEYNAYDIRKETLQLCNCNVYSSIPKRKFDLRRGSPAILGEFSSCEQLIPTKGKAKNNIFVIKFFILFSIFLAL